MSQSPQRGQSGATTDFRPVGTQPTHGSDSRAAGGHENGFGGNGSAHAHSSSYGAPAHSDAPTGTIPPLVTGTAFPQQPGGAPSGASATGAHESASRAAGQRTRARGPRRARLQLRHINPWTVLKFSCVLSIALFFVWLIVIGVLFGVLDAAGIIGKINSTVTTLQGSGGPPVTAGIVFGGAAIIGVVNIVLFIALSTIGSMVYNLCADLVGGVEITLSER